MTRSIGDAIDKLTRVRGLVGLVGALDAASGIDPRALSELGWTLEERFDEALAALNAALDEGSSE